MSKRPRIKRTLPSARVVFTSINESYATEAASQLRTHGEYYKHVTVQRRNIGTLEDPLFVFKVYAVLPEGFPSVSMEFNRSRILTVNKIPLTEWLDRID